MRHVHVVGLLGLFERSSSARQLQQDACACAWCVQNVGGGYCNGDECTIHHCIRSGFECSCYLPCPCATCVRKGGEQPYCESIWGNCSCLIPDDGSTTPPLPAGELPVAKCGNFNVRTDAVNSECCDEPSEDCSSGRPATCNPGCAHVLLPYFKDCSDALGDAAAASFDDVVQLCRAATCPVGGFFDQDSSSCVPCAIGFFKAEEGLQECTECLDGTTTLGSGSIGPSQCVPPPPPPAGAVTCPPITNFFTPDDHVMFLRACDVAAEPGATCMVGCDIANGFRPATSGLPGTKFTCGSSGTWEGEIRCAKTGTGGH